MFWKKKKYEYRKAVFNDKLLNIEEQYNKFVETDGIEIVSTALSQDFSKFEHTEMFVFIVTYKVSV